MKPGTIAILAGLAWVLWAANAKAAGNGSSNGAARRRSTAPGLENCTEPPSAAYPSGRSVRCGPGWHCGPSDGTCINDATGRVVYVA